MTRRTRTEAWRQPVEIGFRHDGWELVEVVRGIDSPVGKLAEWRFVRDDGDKGEILGPSEYDLTVSVAKDHLFGIVYRRREEALSIEYARMC